MATTTNEREIDGEENKSMVTGRTKRESSRWRRKTRSRRGQHDNADGLAKRMSRSFPFKWKWNDEGGGNGGENGCQSDMKTMEEEDNVDMIKKIIIDAFSAFVEFLGLNDTQWSAESDDETGERNRWQKQTESNDNDDSSSSFHGSKYNAVSLANPNKSSDVFAGWDTPIRYFFFFCFFFLRRIETHQQHSRLHFPVTMCSH